MPIELDAVQFDPAGETSLSHSTALPMRCGGEAQPTCSVRPGERRADRQHDADRRQHTCNPMQFEDRAHDNPHPFAMGGIRAQAANFENSDDLRTGIPVGFMPLPTMIGAGNE